MSVRLFAGLGVGIVIISLAALVSAAANEIVIEATKLSPPFFKTSVGERVTFVNRSGRNIHVDFLGDSGRHRVFQVPTEIWAIFHRPGMHPFEVHLSGPRVVTLRGTVEAVEDPSGRGDPHTCDSLTVMGVCIEP